jgi:hypothetical protein
LGLKRSIEVDDQAGQVVREGLARFIGLVRTLPEPGEDGTAHAAAGKAAVGGFFGIDKSSLICYNDHYLVVPSGRVLRRCVS